MDNTTQSLLFNILSSAPVDLLEDGEITVNSIVLTTSFEGKFPLGVTAQSNITIDAGTGTDNPEKIEDYLYDIEWVENQTERITIGAEIEATGPNGETCSGYGSLDFGVEYI